MEAMPPPGKDLVLFDGVCDLCNRSVRFIAKRDPAGRFLFASLQSKTGADLRLRFAIPEDTDSLILIQGESAHLRSEAALRIAGGLRFPWSMARVFRVVPRSWRDAAYDLVARWRHRFNKHDHCRVGDIPNLRERIVDLSD